MLILLMDTVITAAIHESITSNNRIDLGKV